MSTPGKTTYRQLLNLPITSLRVALFESDDMPVGMAGSDWVFDNCIHAGSYWFAYKVLGTRPPLVGPYLAGFERLAQHYPPALPLVEERDWHTWLYIGDIILLPMWAAWCLFEPCMQGTPVDEKVSPEAWLEEVYASSEPGALVIDSDTRGLAQECDFSE